MELRWSHAASGFCFSVLIGEISLTITASSDFVSELRILAARVVPVVPVVPTFNDMRSGGDF